MTAPKIDTQAPERVWLKPCDPCKAPDDYYVCDPECLDGREAEYIFADISTAREAAAAQAMREAAVDACHHQVHATSQRYGHKSAHGAMDCREAIKALPLPDTAALDRLIAERVREAFEEAAKIVELDLTGGAGIDEEIDSAMRSVANRIRARGSKEGRDG